MEMKGIAKILGCIAVADLFTVVSGCSDSSVHADLIGLGGKVENYITWYRYPTALGFQTVAETGVNYIYINPGGYLDSEKNHELSVKYNDLSYNQIQSVPVVALYDGVTSLSMETVDYFDEDHPAGSDISDIIFCQYLTYYDFITSGYVPIDKDWTLYPLLSKRQDQGTKLYEMMLPEVNYDNSQLMDYEMIIEFTAEPEISGSYEFIFHFNMPEIELETTFEYEFQ